MIDDKRLVTPRFSKKFSGLNCHDPARFNGAFFLVSIWCQIAPTVPVLPVVSTYNYCAVNNLGNEASMAWKRSSVRSRPGPPNPSRCQPSISSKVNRASGSISVQRQTPRQDWQSTNADKPDPRAAEVLGSWSIGRNSRRRQKHITASSS